MPLPQNLELNDRFLAALEVMEKTKNNVFITGKAGTGKSTLLEYFRFSTGKKIAVLAPTGVAALNVRCETMHSFFGFRPDTTLKKVRKLTKRQAEMRGNIYKKIDAIVIDEVSMVRADFLDCIDKFLRLNGPEKERPFGGVQMIFIGDLYQLPPVVTGKERGIFKSYYKSQYFFDAKIFGLIRMEFVELEKIYRQKDQVFIDLLNDFRNKTVTDFDLELINSRVGKTSSIAGDYPICLTSTNAMADSINGEELSKLENEEAVYKGSMDGDFGKDRMPTLEDLKLKPGAQVMMLNNDRFGRWVNGSLGRIKSVGPQSVVVTMENGADEEVIPHTWEIFHFQYDEGKGALKSETVGTFTQLPLKLAWAVTIHKSQGLTFDKVTIDVGRGTFAHGQMYVALSRCRSLDGITLKSPLKKTHVLMDWKVRDFITQFQYKKSDEKMPLEDKIKVIKEAAENGNALEIVYLKATDEKSRRRIIPVEVGEMEYKDKKYIGMKAHCGLRGELRTFRVDRILEIETTADHRLPTTAPKR